MDKPRIDQVLPDGRTEVELAPLYEVDRSVPPDRPYVIVGMIASLDGATAIEGRSTQLGNTTDHGVLMALRRAADVIIVGSATVSAENYGPSSVEGQRIGVCTISADLDYDSDLFRSGCGFVIAPRSASVPDSVDVVRAGTDEVDFAEAIPALRDLLGPIRTVVAEGGPTINGALLNDGVVDEVCVTTAPTLVGGRSHRIVVGHEHLQSMRLAHLLVDSDGYLFARWVRAEAGLPADS